MAIPNPIVAIVTFLKADATLAALVGTKVFGAELPNTETENMPQLCVVVSPAGGSGPGSNSNLSFMSLRLDLKCYGTTPLTAWSVYLAVRDALKGLEGSVKDTVLLYDASIEGGPINLRDADLEWPLVLGTFNLRVSETAVA